MKWDDSELFYGGDWRDVEKQTEMYSRDWFDETCYCMDVGQEEKEKIKDETRISHSRNWMVGGDIYWEREDSSFWW